MTWYCHTSTTLSKSVSIRLYVPSPTLRHHIDLTTLNALVPNEHVVVIGSGKERRRCQCGGAVTTTVMVAARDGGNGFQCAHRRSRHQKTTSAAEGGCGCCWCYGGIVMKRANTGCPHWGKQGVTFLPLQDLLLHDDGIIPIRL